MYAAMQDLDTGRSRGQGGSHGPTLLSVDLHRCCAMRPQALALRSSAIPPRQSSTRKCAECERNGTEIQGSGSRCVHKVWRSQSAGRSVAVRNPSRNQVTRASQVKVWLGTISGAIWTRDATRDSDIATFAAKDMQHSGDGGVKLRYLDGSRDISTGAAADERQKELSNEVDTIRNGDVGTAQGQKLLTLPTMLTLARVAAVPAMLAVFYSQETWATAAGASIFVGAAITDWLDGYLARKMGSSSAFGAFLDPVADKLMVASTLVLLCTRPPASTWAFVAPWLVPIPAITIIGREITMSALREWAASQGGDLHKAVAVNNLGKVKTASQMVALTLLLATRDGGGGAALGAAGISLLYIAAGLALWSLAVYIKAMCESLTRART